jgi:hypothetical protein
LAIGNDNLWSGTYSTVKAFLEANLTDPRNRFKDNWVHPGEVNISAKGFNGFPFIILRCDYSDDALSLDISTTNKLAVVTFEIISDTASEVDDWADQIYNDIRTEGNLEEIKAKRVQTTSIERAVDENGKKVYRRTVTLAGRFRK